MDINFDMTVKQFDSAHADRAAIPFTISKTKLSFIIPLQDPIRADN